MEINIKMDAEDAIKILTVKHGNKELVEKQPPLNNSRSLVEQVPKSRKSSSGKIKQVTWSAEEKAWLKKQSKPCKANGHYQKTLEFLFGKHRTIKSIDGCWRRLQRNN